MAIDIVARGLATSLLDNNGKISSEKMPTLAPVPEDAQFYPVGALDDPKLLEGKTSEEILLMILYGIVSPTLTNPSLNIQVDSLDTVTVGEKAIISGTMSFDRGAIAPPYGTSGYRSGAPLQYTVNNIPTEVTFSVEIEPVLGDNIITCEVSYAEGEQPLNSIGQPYGTPLAAGAISKSFVIQGVNPLLSSSGEKLEFTWFEDTDGEGYQSILATESATEKQSFSVVLPTTVVGIKQYEEMTKTWQWIGGSAKNSLTYFDIEVTDNNIAVYTHNGSLTGKRELRVYVE